MNHYPGIHPRKQLIKSCGKCPEIDECPDRYDSVRVISEYVVPLWIESFCPGDWFLSHLQNHLSQIAYRKAKEKYHTHIVNRIEKNTNICWNNSTCPNNNICWNNSIYRNNINSPRQPYRKVPSDMLKLYLPRQPYRKIPRHMFEESPSPQALHVPPAAFTNTPIKQRKWRAIDYEYRPYYGECGDGFDDVD